MGMKSSRRTTQSIAPPETATRFPAVAETPAARGRSLDTWMTSRVLHIVDSLRPTVGSVATVLPGLFKSLAEAGWKSMVATRDGLAESTVDVDVVSCSSGAITRWLRDANVVHVHGGERAFLVSILPDLRRSGVPVVVSPLGALCPNSFDAADWKEAATGGLFRRRLGQTARVLGAANEAELADLERRRPGSCVRLLSYGVDAPASDEDANDVSKIGSLSGGGSEWTEQERYVLLSAPIHPIEGIVPLLRAVAELGYECRDCRIVMAGPMSGDWKAQLEAAIERKGFAARTVMAIDPDAAAQAGWRRRAAVVAAPSLRIRASFSAMQALVAGVPVVTTREAMPGHVEELVRVCRPDRRALRVALSEVLVRSNDERRRDARMVREQAVRLLSWKQRIGDWVAVYSELACAKTKTELSPA